MEEINEKRNKQNPEESKVYLVGPGIASLASAVYLTKDAGVLGENIHILERDHIPGGALDGAGDPKKGFVVRGGRMHEMIMMQDITAMTSAAAMTGKWIMKPVKLLTKHQAIFQHRILKILTI